MGGPPATASRPACALLRAGLGQGPGDLEKQEVDGGRISGSPTVSTSSRTRRHCAASASRATSLLSNIILKPPGKRVRRPGPSCCRRGPRAAWRGFGHRTGGGRHDLLAGDLNRQAKGLRAEMQLDHVDHVEGRHLQQQAVDPVGEPPFDDAGEQRDRDRVDHTALRAVRARTPWRVHSQICGPTGRSTSQS